MPNPSAAASPAREAILAAQRAGFQAQRDAGLWVDAKTAKGNGRCCPGSHYRIACDTDCPDLLAAAFEASMPCPPGRCWEPDPEA